MLTHRPTHRHTLPLACLTTLVLLLSSSLHAAILPSQDSSASTSASGSSANQRSARSVLDPRTGEGVEEGEKVGDVGVGKGDKGCSADFVEQFFRILSGPIGKEAEAVVAAVLKLLSENDRVNWMALAPQLNSHSSADAAADADSNPISQPANDNYDDDDEAESRFSFSRSRVPRHHFGGLRHNGIVPDYGFALSSKRASPKFTPTGWRRKKRSATTPLSFNADSSSSSSSDLQSAAEIKHLLKTIMLKHAGSSEERRKLPSSAEASASEEWRKLPSSAEALAFEEWRKLPSSAEALAELAERPLTLPTGEGRGRKRNGRLILRRGWQQQQPHTLKRKPLEFTPTGW